MQVRLKDGLVVLTAEPGEEASGLVEWARDLDGHAFVLKAQDARTVLLKDLGPRPEACREPINVVSTSADPVVQLISNFSHTPFDLDDERYASVEGFWQSLKYPGADDRRRIASLYGQEAKRAGSVAPEAETFVYRGATYRVGTAEHWALMRRACEAKFTQHTGARAALLSTGARPLVHRTRRDSRTIPGVVMADIWMKVRARLAGQLTADEDAPGDE